MTDAEDGKKKKKRVARKKKATKEPPKADLEKAAENPEEGGMDKYAVEEREEDLGGGMKLIKRADGSGMVKAAGRTYELDSVDEDRGMAKFAEAPPSKVKGQLEGRGYRVK